MQKPSFVSRVGLVFAATAAGTTLLNLTLLLVGRWIGPEAFGAYFIAYSISIIIVLPTGYGIGPATTFAVAHSGDARPLCIATITFTAVAGLLTSGLWAVRAPLAGLLAVPEPILAAGILFSLPLASYLFLEYAIKGFRHYLSLAILRVLVPIGFFFGVIVQVFGAGRSDFTVPLWGRAVAYISVSAAAIIILLRWWSRVDWRGLGAFLRYACAVTAASAGSVVFISADKLLLAPVFTPQELGIYSALFLASFLIAGRLSEALITVMFPESVRHNATDVRSAAFVNSHDRVRIMGAFIAMPVLLVAAQFVAILILGDRYHVSWQLVILLAIGASLYGAADIRWWYLSSFGNREMRMFGLSSGATSAILILSLLIFAPTYGLTGAAVAYLVASSFNLTVSLICKHQD